MRKAGSCNGFSDGRRVFVIGGVLSPGAQVDEAKPIHVLGHEVCTALFVISFEQPSSLKQSSSFTRNPTSTSSILVREGYPTCAEAIRGSPEPRVNHNRHPFRRTRMSTQKMALPLFKMLPPENWTILPLCRSLAIEPSVRNDLPSLSPGMSDKPRRVPEEDDDCGGSMEPHAKFVAPDGSFKKEVGTTGA